MTAYFGSHVASYFVFLRFLVYLDLLLAVLLLGLVTLPQVMIMVNKINFWSTWITDTGATGTGNAATGDGYG